jgi:dihydrodipicolinate synthase/N-acetylneuraminate lyase
MSAYPNPPSWVTEALQAGLVIPAHPLALTAARQWDEARQRALTRYYHAAGAGGLAVGVHTTQFEIRDPAHGLLAPVLRCAAQTVREHDRATGRRTVLIAGLCGRTAQALREAALARECGYDVGLLALGAWQGANDDQLVQHAQAVAEAMPLMGFYLQPAVGGRELGRSFWSRFVEIPNVVALKIAPFNRYQTLEVLRAVAESARADAVALYTGNDDHIVLDLISGYSLGTPDVVDLHFAGGLLGHWAFGTRRAVELLAQCHAARLSGRVPMRLLTLATQVTEFNAAAFDATHGFAGCLPGIHEVLRRQGLLANHLCLDPTQTLSPGQAEEIDRVCRLYPHLTDEGFVREHLERWLD